VITDDGRKLGYAVREVRRNRWVVNVYDGEPSIETHREIAENIENAAGARLLIEEWHEARGSI
jgi:hypothetical protein